MELTVGLVSLVAAVVGLVTAVIGLLMAVSHRNAVTQEQQERKAAALRALHRVALVVDANLTHYSAHGNNLLVLSAEEHQVVGSGKLHHAVSKRWLRLVPVRSAARGEVANRAASRLVVGTGWLLRKDHRQRYVDEWLAELDMQDSSRARLRFAVRTFLRIGLLRLARRRSVASASTPSVVRTTSLTVREIRMTADVEGDILEAVEVESGVFRVTVKGRSGQITCRFIDRNRWPGR